MRFLSLAAIFAVAASTTAPTVDEFFADFAKKREPIERLEARFVQDTVTPDETTRTIGYIVYQKPRRIMLRYLDPEVTYLVDGNRVYQYNVELEQVQVYDLDDDPQLEALFLGFDSDTNRLRDAYSIELFDPDPSTCGEEGLRLLPLPAEPSGAAGSTDESVAPLFQEIALYLRGDDLLPCRIHVINDAESNVEISVDDFKINDAAGDAAARIDLPEGTMIIENEENVEQVGPGGKWIPVEAGATAEPAP